MAKFIPHRCMWSPAKRGNFLVCSTCDDRFPCAGNTCGHLDCIETRRKPPQCHYCTQVCEGPPKGSWTPWAVHGHTRAVHYSCRNDHASPADCSRWGGLDGKDVQVQTRPLAP